MKCDHCENEATVHEVTRKSGVTIEKHLCEKCAASGGVSIEPTSPLAEALQFALNNPPVIAMSVSGSPAAVPEKMTACPSCGLSFSEFKATGHLGCPNCYRVFEAQIGPLIERAHEGATHHVGKVPKRLLGGAMVESEEAQSVLGDLEERNQRRIALRKQLEDAVRGEQYELAAKLRDQIAKLSEMGILPPDRPGLAAQG